MLYLYQAFRELVLHIYRENFLQDMQFQEMLYCWHWKSVWIGNTCTYEKAEGKNKN